MITSIKHNNNNIKEECVLASRLATLKFTTIFFISLILLFPLFISTAHSFDNNNNNNNNNTKKIEQISGFRIKIRRLQRGIDDQENKIQNTEDKERNLLSELEVLDKKLAEEQTKLELLETKMSLQRAFIEKESKALDTIHSEKIIVEKHLEKRIKAYYTMGDIGLLNVTFSTKTLPELLLFHDAFDSLIRYDQDVIKVYKETIADLESAKTALTLEKSVLQEFIDQVIEEKKLVTRAKIDKKSLLTHIRTQTKLHKQAIKEMQIAASQLSDALVSLKSSSQVGNQNFFANKGNLPPPVDGVIVTLFQEEKINKLGITRKSHGITLKTADGTEIKAISDGTVIFSGYLRGYGNTVIIHHGFQYYTVTSRIEKLLVQKGDMINAEQPIGITGDTATLFDEGLYFEIRHGKQSLDPLIWLNPNRLSAAEDSFE